MGRQRKPVSMELSVVLTSLHSLMGFVAALESSLLLYLNQFLTASEISQLYLHITST